MKIPCEKQIFIAQPFLGIPPLSLYALAGGIRTIPTGTKSSPPPELQLNLHLELLISWSLSKEESPLSPAQTALLQFLVLS